MQTSDVNLREYTKIFTGTNQDDGYETPFFGFTSDTTELTLKKDKSTYFHYPINAPSGLLIDSSLIEDGATAGETPFSSDKIWKKQANYRSNSIWGNSQPVGKQTGVWLCSWLSFNTLGISATPVWKDRWYNPGYIDAQSALFVANPVASSIIIDIDSEMTLEGGSYYKYFHVGDIHNNTLVDNLTTGSHLKLYLEDWSQNPIDLSTNNNKSTIQNFTDECVNYQGVNYLQRPDDNCLKEHKTNYCETLYSSAIALTGTITYNVWARADDWTKGTNTILSKDNRGGYALKIDQGFDTRYMMFLDDTGKMVLLNPEGHIIDSSTLPQPSNPTSLVMDYNHFTWVSDNSAKKVYKIDYNGDILKSIDFDSTANLQKIDLDEVGNLCVLDTTSSRISAFNIFTNEFIAVKSGLFYEAYMGNSYSSYLSGAYEGIPPPTSAANIIHNGYFNFNDSYLLEKRLTNSIKSSNLLYPSISGDVAYTPLISGNWLGQTQQAEHYGLIWSGVLKVPQDGTYTFRTQGDDYLKLSANQVLIASSYYIDGFVDTSYTMLSSSTYDIRVEMGEWQAGDYYSLRWKNTAIPSMSAFQDFGSSIYLTPNGTGINNFTIDLSGNVVAYECADLLVDNNNNQWVLVDNKLYKNTILVDCPVSGTNIACDKDDSIWVLFDVNSYLKMNATTFEYTSGTIGSNSTLTDRAIGFTYELNANNEWVQYNYFTFANEQRVYKTDSNGTFIRSIDLSVFDLYPMLTNFTAFDWQRKFNYLKYDKVPQLKADLFAKNGTNIQKHTLSTPVTVFNDQNWHMFTYTSDKNNLKLYIDCVLRDSESIGIDTNIYYTYENSLMLGADAGKIEPLSKEFGLASNYFAGKIDALRIYDCVLNNFDILHLYLNKYDYSDLVWNIPTGTQSYIEEIVRFFKFKLPGQKSQYYNINLIGLQLENEELKAKIENIIKDTVKKVSPAYAELYKIVWK